MVYLYLIVLVCSLLVGYLCGSVPFALVLGQRLYGIDVREHGSGNTGSTNVMRVLGVRAGLLVFACDCAKGAVAVFVGMGLSHLFESLFLDAAWEGLTILTTGWTYELLLLLCALAAVVGHMFSPFLNFKGGKGVATALGGVLAVLPIPGLCALAVFALVAFATRYVSLASICAAVALPVLVVLFDGGSPLYICFACCITVALVWAHRSNIDRLVHHTEKRFHIDKVVEGGAQGAVANVPDDGFDSVPQTSTVAREAARSDPSDTSLDGGGKGQGDAR